MIKALIFDCFGVVVTDAVEAIIQSVRQTDPRKADQITDIVLATIHGLLPSEESTRRIAALLGTTPEAYRTQVQTGEVKDQSLLDYIAGLHKRYRTAMLSNVSREGFKRRFAPGELESYFDAVVASGDVGFAKPEPEAYAVVAERLGVRLEDCLMIDDREIYCDGARAVGMQAMLYTDFANFKKQLAALL